MCGGEAALQAAPVSFQTDALAAEQGCLHV